MNDLYIDKERLDIALATLEEEIRKTRRYIAQNSTSVEDANEMFDNVLEVVEHLTEGLMHRHKEMVVADIMGIIQRTLFPDGYKLSSDERTTLLIEITRVLKNYEEVIGPEEA